MEKRIISRKDCSVLWYENARKASFYKIRLILAPPRGCGLLLGLAREEIKA